MIRTFTCLHANRDNGVAWTLTVDEEQDTAVFSSHDLRTPLQKWHGSVLKENIERWLAKKDWQVFETTDIQLPDGL